MKRYDPKQVIVTFLGQNINGFQKGTFVDADRNVDTFTLQIGAHGDATRTRSHNKSGKVTFTLMQGADSNAVLSAAHAADEAAGISVGPLLISDLNGAGCFVFAKEAFITRPAKKTFADEAGDRQWILVAPEMHFAEQGYLPAGILET